MRIILGSSSPRRKALLAKIVPEFQTISPDFDEKTIRHSDPEELVVLLARAKAKALMSQISEPSLLVTSDVVVVFQGGIREKAHSLAEARQFLKDYSGRSLDIYTSAVVTNTETKEEKLGIKKATIYMHELPDEAIECILKDGQVLSWAGAYAIQDETTAKYVKKVEGDLEAIIGLPLDLIKKFIKEFKYG